jgi:predicted esterase
MTFHAWAHITETVSGPHAGAAIAQVGAPLGEGAGVVLMIHGRGASPQSILSLAPVLDRPDFTYLAPGAVGNAWYPYSFLSERAQNEPYLTSALSLVSAVVESLENEGGVAPERIVLLGFSQGACLSSEWTYRNPKRYGGLIVYSGGLIGPLGTAFEAEGSLGGTPIFLGCSDVDAHIPEVRVHETARAMEALGATVTARIYPGMGHLINEDEIAEGQRILDQVAAL